MNTFGSVFNNRYLFDDDSYRGEWVTGTEYQPGDIIAVGSDLYRCTINHTSGVFIDDINSSKLKLHVGVSNLELLSGSKGDSMVGVQQPFSGSVLRTQHDKNVEALNLKDFGAVGDGITDDTTACNNFINAVFVSGLSGYVPAGTYLVSSQITFNIGFNENVRTRGFTFIGDGIRRSVFKNTTTVTPAFSIVNNATTTNAFYPTIKDIGFESNLPGVGFQIGKSDLTDEINAIKLEISSNNSNASASSCGTEFNGVYQGTVNITTNTGGTGTLGDALRLRQAQFISFTGSGGNAANSVHITGGYSYGNVFLNWDAEEVKYCYVIDVSSAVCNTFIGGQNSWSVGCINATAGNNNIFINPNFGLSMNQVVASTGISIEGQGHSYGNAYLPTTTFKNNTASTDSFNTFDCVTGTRSGVIFSENGVQKAMIDKDGSCNLVFRASNNGGSSWTDAGYINPSGQWIVTNANIQNFGLAKTPVAKQTVTGSRGGNTAVASILNALVQFGLITDSTTA